MLWLPLALAPGLVPLPGSPPIRAPSAPYAGELSGAKMLAAPEKRLHRMARLFTLNGAFDDAMKCHEKACSMFGSARSFLLAALLYSRAGEAQLARATFAEGILRHRDDAQLMQAWGLFESKQDQPRRAFQLVKRAVALDPSLAGVLQWRRFRDPITMSATQTSRAKAPTQPRRIVIQPPRVRYTIPSHQVLGWKGRAEMGEDPQKWYDANGERSGVPQNYWRQAMDERVHATSVEAARLVLDSARDESALAGLEERMSIAKPMLNRKLLGKWGVLVAGGSAVAENLSDGSFRTSAVIEIVREGGRRMQEHRYGRVDMHLEVGEQVLVTLDGPMGAGADGSIRARSSGRMNAWANNERRVVSLQPEAAAVEEAEVPSIGLGGVTLLNDYLLVMREGGDASGRLLDVMIRVSDE